MSWISEQEQPGLTRSQWPWFQPIQHTEFGQTTGLVITASRQLQPAGTCQQLIGWAVCETTGTTSAAFRLRDGTDLTGAILARVNLAANESNRERAGPPGLRCTSGGIYLEFISGSFEGVVYWI